MFAVVRCKKHMRSILLLLSDGPWLAQNGQLGEVQDHQRGSTLRPAVRCEFVCGTRKSISFPGVSRLALGSHQAQKKSEESVGKVIRAVDPDAILMYEPAPFPAACRQADHRSLPYPKAAGGKLRKLATPILPLPKAKMSKGAGIVDIIFQTPTFWRTGHLSGYGSKLMVPFWDRCTTNFRLF